MTATIRGLLLDWGNSFLEHIGQYHVRGQTTLVYD